MSPMNNRLLRPLASGFSPKSIAGLAAWFDASDLTTLSQTSDGTTPVTADDDPVAYWKCKATGTAITQTTDANRPLWKASSAIGSKPGLDFDGANDYLFATSGELMQVARNVPGVTLFAVMRLDDLSTRGFWSFSVNAGTNQFRLRVSGAYSIASNNWQVGGRRLDADTFQIINAATLTASEDYILRQTYDYANSDIFAHINGSPGASSTSFQTDGNSQDTDSAYVMLGSQFSSDAFTNTAPSFNGIICEFIVYKRALTAAESARVEGYLSKKYGITLA